VYSAGHSYRRFGTLCRAYSVFNIVFGVRAAFETSLLLLQRVKNTLLTLPQKAGLTKKGQMISQSSRNNIFYWPKLSFVLEQIAVQSKCVLDNIL
jgi:hypothetical protein